MAQIAKLDDAALAAALAKLPGWKKADGRDAITKEFTLPAFPAAVGFMVHVAMLAERQYHYPEFVNLYSRVIVTMSTHDAGGVSERDIKLAQAIEEFAGR